MKRPIKKIGPALLAAALLFSVFACGCTVKSGKTGIKDESGLTLSGKMPDKLPDGMSWFDFKEETAIFDYLENTIGEIFLIDITCYKGQTWLYICEREPKVPVYHIMSFDENDKPVNDFVIKNEFGDNIDLARMIQGGDGLYITAYDFAARRDYLYPVDENTGKVSPDNKIDVSKDQSGDYSVNALAFAGDDIAVLQNAQTPRVELISKTGESKKTVYLEALSRDFNIQYPEGMIGAGPDKVVVWGNTSSNYYFGQIRYCLVDLESGKVSAMDELEYINIPLRNLTYCNGSLVSVTDGGVYTIDTDKGTCQMTLSFNCSNCNRYLANNSELKYADDEKLLFGYTSTSAKLGQLRYSICTFTKTADYPAAGKNILTVASTEDLDYSISKAIMQFNSTSDSSFMVFDSRYKANAEIDYSNIDSADRAAKNSLTAYASVSDRLAMDIMAGEGPDILITNGANEQLSRSEYFIDLTDYLRNESGISESDYFMNAINAMKFNGALYQFPIGFYVDGLLASGDCFGNKNGLTFDEYKTMVKTVCNGSDPVYDHQLSYSRTEVATKLFANTNEMYIKDGKVNVNNDSFKAILDYCKDLPAKSYFEGKDLDMEYEDLMTGKDNMPVQPVVVYGFYDYEAMAMKNENTMICGYPSVDGRTATIGSELSVSISAHSYDLSSCKKFLSILLSEDIQNSIERNIPINKNCAKNQALEEIEANNKTVERNADNKWAGKGKKLDASMADSYIEQLSSAKTSSFVYHNISLIIYEEIPAYFEGQKSFEEVAVTINDRAQKVLDERK